MTTPSAFNFNTQQLRVIELNGAPWFVAADVCAAIGTQNTADTIKRLDDDERGIDSIYTPSGKQEMTIINESGLYSLILGSRKPEAKVFKKWVTSEVLPSIRKHGRYDDKEGKINTLIGQTIGTDGFHMLGAVVKGKVSSLPVPVQRRATAKIWSQTHAAFGVRSAADIPAEQLDAARNFIAAYALEGEWLGKENSLTVLDGGIRLSRNETHHLYLLMSRYFIINMHKDQIRTAYVALDSELLKKIWSQLHEGIFSFKALDARRSEIYSEHCALGMEGGYAALA